MYIPLSLPFMLGVATVTTLAQAQTPLETCYQGANTRIDMSDCLDDRRRSAEAALEKTVMAAYSRAADIGKVSGRPEIAAAFEDSENAFREYLDRHCAWIGVMAVGGSDAGDMTQDCTIRLTEQHTLDLSTQLSAGAVAMQPQPGKVNLPAVIPPGDWRLIHLERDGQSVKLPADPEVTLNFERNGMVAGRGPVNRYFGKATIASNGQVSWAGAIGSTRMAGPQDLMDAEQAYLKALGRIGRWEAVGEVLTLRSKDGAVLIRYSR